MYQNAISTISMYVKTLINIWVSEADLLFNISEKQAPPQFMYTPQAYTECSTLDLHEWWEVSHQFTVSSGGQTRFAVEPSTFIYYITWFELFSHSSSGVDFSAVVQKFHSRFGFTEMSTMLKIYMACILLFLFTYAHGVYRVSEKSISLYPPIRIYVSFRIDIW